MADLFLHGRKVESVFELLGFRENDITYSLGWAFAQCPELLRRIVARVLPDAPPVSGATIQLQESHEEGGYTDIEITYPKVHIIVEAKRGWGLPTQVQLAKYAKRFNAERSPHRVLITCSDCTEEYANLSSASRETGAKTVHLSWRTIANDALIARGTHSERRLLRELKTYLANVIMNQNQLSNSVYVVSLGADTPAWSTLSWRDVVNKKARYFHPAGDGWPKEPPNYLAFRYDGKLQGIYHVEASVIVHDLHDEISEVRKGEMLGPLFVHTLGPKIMPPHEVRLGKLHPSGRYNAAIDLLLTSDTVAEAVTKTKQRIEPA